MKRGAATPRPASHLRIFCYICTVRHSTYNKDRRMAYGQNYLKNPALARRLVKICPFSKSYVVELGPGRGVFTKELVNTFDRTIAIEIDQENIDLLKHSMSGEIKLGKLTLIQDDALSFSIKSLGREITHTSYNLFGNIPYNISSQLTKRYLLKKPFPTAACLTVQKEFAERILNLKKTELLGVLLAVFYDMQIIYHYNREDFSPAPGVDSVLLSFVFRKEVPEQILLNFGEFKDFVKSAYVQPIKSVRQFTKNMLAEGKLQKLADKHGFNIKDPVNTLSAQAWQALFLHTR